MQQGKALNFASPQLRKDVRICRFAVKQDANALQFVKFQTRDIVEIAVSSNGSSLQFANESFKENRYIV
jgi:hypothetical protein